ncbi:MAG: hypothetical protein DI535_17825 [Citrobacter freundii]|nr:MAG: hypothetical protein DI535_17825 [Citrobacter freundii]
MAELSLWLDNYDDIYSDFDVRTLLKRRVSEDSVYELGMTYKRKEENTDLLLNTSFQCQAELNKAKSWHTIAAWKILFKSY